jgi:hypothetical protein
VGYSAKTEEEKMKRVLMLLLIMSCLLISVEAMAQAVPVTCELKGGVLVTNGDIGSIGGQPMTGVMFGARCYPVCIGTGRIGYFFWIPEGASNYREMLSVLLSAWSMRQNATVGLTWNNVTLDSGEGMGEVVNIVIQPYYDVPSC